MLVLLSPSKKIAKNIKTTAPESVSATTPPLAAEAGALVGKLKDFSRDDIKALMSLSDNLAELNHDRYQHFDEQEQGPALYTFKGDVYDKMDVDAYDKDDLSFAQQHVRILSGLYGILRPLDNMRPYRLEMGTRLKTGQGKNLYEYWGDKITETLNNDGDPLVLNLASQEYFKAVKPEALKADVINVDFKHTKNGKTKTIGLMAKRARGLMTDYIIKKRITDPADLEGFNLEGYKFAPGMSGESTLTFTLNMDK